MAVVYRHIRLDTKEVFYVGIGKTVSRAYSKHGRSKPWLDLIKNRNYEVEILFENVTWQEAEDKERELIKLHGRRDQNTGTLVNLTDGGGGVENPSAEARRKNGDAHKGKPGWNRGLTKETDSRVADYAKKLTGKGRSEKHCNNISKSKVGKPRSVETILKIKAAKLKNGTNRRTKESIEKGVLTRLANGRNKHSEETKLKLSKARIGKYGGGNNPRAIAVKQIDKHTGCVLNIYSCATDAAKATGVDNANIRGACTGKYKSAGGFIWKNTTKEEYGKYRLKKDNE